MKQYCPIKLFIERDVRNSPLVRRVREALPPGVPVEFVADEREARLRPDVAHQLSLPQGKRHLLLARNKGAYFKPFHKNYGEPGPYLNCEETVLEFANQCSMECTYCILQALLNSPLMVMYANTEDVPRELDAIAAAWPAGEEPFLRVGTGEYTDSLVLERLTGFHADLIGRLGRWPNVFLEMKTKTVNVGGFEGLDHGGRAVVSWSLSAPRVAREDELLTAPLEARLAAARRVQEWGYPVALHFDPMIHFEGWREEYAELVERTFAAVDPARVIWASVGALRFPPPMKRIMARRFPRTKIIFGEFVTGPDGRLRYFRDVRREMFGWMIERLGRHLAPEQIYFSMESADMWEEFLGERPDGVAAIRRRFDRRCAAMLGATITV